MFTLKERILITPEGPVIWGIIVVVTIFTVLKLWISTLEIAAGHNRFSWPKTLRRRSGDWIFQVFIFLSLYLCLFVNNIVIQQIGLYLSLAATIYTVFKLSKEIFGKDTFLLESHDWGHQYVTLVYFFHFFRNYLYIALLFTFADLYLINIGDESIIYQLKHTSNNYFFDFFYYTVSTITTLGTGEIQPVSIFAKFLSIIKVFVGIFILMSYLSTIFGNYVTKMNQKEADRKLSI